MPLAEKDISEKTLEAYNNVFADIVNVLLFDGEPVVDEYFTQMHRTGEYVPETEYPEHVHEVLQLLSVMAGDHRFEAIFNEKSNSEVKTMSEFLNKVEARGEARGEARAAARYEKEIAAMAAENAKLKAQLAAQAAR